MKDLPKEVKEVKEAKEAKELQGQVNDLVMFTHKGQKIIALDSSDADDDWLRICPSTPKQINAIGTWGLGACIGVLVTNGQYASSIHDSYYDSTQIVEFSKFIDREKDNLNQLNQNTDSKVYIIFSQTAYCKDATVNSDLYDPKDTVDRIVFVNALGQHYSGLIEAKYSTFFFDRQTHELITSVKQESVITSLSFNPKTKEFINKHTRPSPVVLDPESKKQSSKKQCAIQPDS